MNDPEFSIIQNILKSLVLVIIIALIYLASIICWLTIAYTHSIAADNSTDKIWLIANRANDWRRYQDLVPMLEQIETIPECRNQNKNYYIGDNLVPCKDYLENFGYQMADGFNAITGEKFEFWHNASGCQFRLFQHDYGIDNNPHFAALIWINCEQLKDILWS